jgi:hypothetical protein
VTTFAAQERPTSYDILAERGNFPAKEQPHKPKDAYLYLCPFHADTDPSLSVHEDRVQWKCWAGCGSGGPGELRRLFGDNYVAPPRPAPAQKKSQKSETQIAGCTLAQLAKAKGLPIEYLRSLGWHDTTYAGKPAVAIPWPGGTHYRVNLDGKPKYLWAKGNKVSILGLDQLEIIRHIGWVLFVEGETDLAAGRLMGLPVVAIPGASTWKAEWALQFQGCQVYVWKEPGVGGETFMSKLADSFWDINVIDAPDGIKDLCDLHDQAGEGAVDFFNVLKTEAKPNHDNSQQAHSKDRPISGELHPWIERGRRDNTKRSALWDFSCETFPDPPGIEPRVKSHVLYSTEEGSALVCDLRSTTWLNPANAAFKKRKFLFHATRKLSTHENHVKYIPVDDWSENVHEAVTKAIERADAQYLAVDNQLARGCWAYLSTVPIDGFELLEDLSGWLVDALKGIRVPDDVAKGTRFRPIRGSHALTKGCDAPVDEDKGRYQVVAVSDVATDWDLIEAELRSAGRLYEEVDPVYRAQHRQGLKFSAGSLKDVQDWVLGLGGTYRLRKQASAKEQESVGVGR